MFGCFGLCWIVLGCFGCNKLCKLLMLYKVALVFQSFFLGCISYFQFKFGCFWYFFKLCSCEFFCRLMILCFGFVRLVGSFYVVNK